MNNVLLLTLRYLRFNRIKTVILVFSVAVAVFLPLVVNLLVRDYQRDLLARAGCALAQGFLFTRALPAQALVAWLERERGGWSAPRLTTINGGRSRQG